MKQLYLDYAATTPVDERVLEKMNACMTFTGIFGNASSKMHTFGQKAAESVAQARKQVAALIGAESRDLLWTSGATEANNLAIQGIAHAGYEKKHIITAKTEHRSVLDVCLFLESQGFEVTYLKPDAIGKVSVETVQAALRTDTLLVSMMHVNNETGVVQDIEGIGAVTRANKVFFHVDAVQSVGKIPINLKTLPVDLLSCSAHKLYGPKGIGVLYMSTWPKVRLAPLLYGGGHERSLRPGTLANHQIVGMGEACHIALLTMQEEAVRVCALRNRLWQGIQHLKGVYLNGDIRNGACGILNVCFSSMPPKALFEALKPLAVSTAAACQANTSEPSHVLLAMGLNEQDAYRSIRFSIGRFTTVEDIDSAIELIVRNYLCQ